MDVTGLRQSCKNACVPFAPDRVIQGPIRGQKQHGNSNRGSLARGTLCIQRTGTTCRGGWSPVRRQRPCRGANPRSPRAERPLTVQPAELLAISPRDLLGTRPPGDGGSVSVEASPQSHLRGRLPQMSCNAGKSLRKINKHQTGFSAGAFGAKAQPTSSRSCQFCLRLCEVALGPKRPKSTPSSKHSANNGTADPPPPRNRHRFP